MSKNYQKAARGWLYALAAVIAGTCFSASPAQSATCFLPSGECSTGKIGAGPGPTPTQEYCIGYNITEKEYNAKYNNACWDCSDSCVKTSGGTFYKCKTVNNTAWDDDYNVCCTDGTKYDKDDKACCPSGGCNHPCSGGKQWSKVLQQCVCPSNVETDSNGNCCEVGQVLENGACTTPCEMNDCGDYPYTSDPGNSVSCDLGCGKGMRYKCQDGYTYSNSTGTCVEKCAALGFTLTSKKDSNCYSCTTCPYDSSKYKCTKSEQTGYQLSGDTCVDKCSDYTLTSKEDEHCYSCTPCPYNPYKFSCTKNEQSGYQLVEGVCSKKPVEKVTITITLEFDEDSSTENSSSYLKFTSEASDSKNYIVNLIIDGDGDNGINYPLTVTKGNWITYMSSYYQDGDCDVYGDCNNEGWDTSSRGAASTPKSLSVVVDGTTVLSSLRSPSGSDLLQLGQFVGKTYTTDNYIIKFAKVDCSKYYETPWVVNGADNSVKCRAINSSYVPCGEQATCGGTQYVECKNSSQCGNGGGSSGNNCTASTYTASITCKQSYTTNECCNAFSCSGTGCGTGYFECVFDVPSCAFSSVSIHATDPTNQDHIVASAGAGQTTRILNNYKIPGPNTPCEFFASSSSLGKVKGEAVSGQAYTWKCSYTRKIR